MSIYIKDPRQTPEACIIWMHGLGADANDMMGIAAELSMSKPIRHIFLDAPVRPVTLNNRMPMRAWYDISGVKLTDREDRPGILASEKLIQSIVEKQKTEGMSTERVFLAGFSQGAAMTLFTGLRMQDPLAGLIVLSGYLPLALETQPAKHLAMPIFMASGDYDPVVLPTWTGMSADHLSTQGYSNVEWHRYPVEHTICAEEMRDLGQWIFATLSSKESK